MKTMDFLSQIYCSKFEEGDIEDEDEESHYKDKNLGIYKMIYDIRDAEYASPLTTLKEINKPKEQQ